VLEDHLKHVGILTDDFGHAFGSRDPLPNRVELYKKVNLITPNIRDTHRRAVWTG